MLEDRSGGANPSPNSHVPEVESVPVYAPLATDVSALRKYTALVKGCTDLDAAVAETTAAVEKAARTGTSWELGASLFLLGLYRYHQNEPALSFEAFEQSLEVWTALAEEVPMALTLQRIGVGLHESGRDDEAVPHEQHALLLFQKHELRNDAARILNNLSVAYKNLGDIARSQELLHECLAYFENVGVGRNTAMILLNIAGNYNVMEQSESAIPFAARGIELLENSGDNFHLALACGVIGTAYVQKEDFDAALESFQRSLDFAEAHGVPSIIAITLGDLGDLFVRMERFEDASAALLRAVHLYRQEGDAKAHRSGFGEAMSRLGTLYANPAFAGRNNERALSLLHEARVLCEESDIAVLLTTIYSALVDLYDRMDLPREALQFSRRLRETERRWFNAQSDQRVRNLQVRFELDKAQKDAEIAHLRSVALADALAETEHLRALAEEHARTDSLTQVLNRRAMDESLQEAFERAQREEQALAVGLLDIDHFKSINDRLGHGIGDDTLRRVAEILRTCCRSGDRAAHFQGTERRKMPRIASGANQNDFRSSSPRKEQIARYGGEEFALLLPDADRAAILTLCERVRSTIAAYDWKSIHPELGPVTISVGVSALDEDNRDQVTTPAALLAEADQNLYRAKRGGRNQVVG